jgi:hypothetical protein
MSFRNVANMLKSLTGKAAAYGGKKLMGKLSPYIGDAAASLTSALHRADMLKPETSEKILATVLKKLTGNLSGMSKEGFKDYMIDQSQRVISDEMAKYHKELIKKEKETEDIIKQFDKSIPDMPSRIVPPKIQPKRLQKQKELNKFLSDLKRQKRQAAAIETEKARELLKLKQDRSVGPLQYYSPPIKRVNYSSNPIFYQSPYKKKAATIQQKKLPRKKQPRKKQPRKKQPRKKQPRKKKPVIKTENTPNPAFATPPKETGKTPNPAFGTPPKTKNYQEQPLPKPKKKSKKKNFNIVI